MTDDLDYIKAEAERLPNGTAAKALVMMGELDSYMRAGSNRPRMDVSQPDTDNAVTHDESFITVTISREDAEHWAQHHPRAIGQYEQRIANAVRAALEGER